MNDETASPPSTPGGRVRVVQSLRRHRRLALMIFLVIMIPGAAFSWVHGRPRYVSTAAIQIQPSFMKTLEEDTEQRERASRYREFLQQQVLNMLRLEVLENAVERLDEQGVPWRQPGESPTQAARRLRDALGVIPLHGSFQIDVELEGYEPAGLAEVVNAVVDAYVVMHRGETFIGGDERIARLEEYRAAQSKAVREKLAEKARLAEQLGVSTFDVSVPSPYQESLLAASASLGSARQRLVEARSRKTALESGQESVLGMEVLSRAQIAVSEDEAIAELLRKLVERRNELYARKVGLTADHPGFGEATEQIAELDAAIAQARQEAIAATAAILEQRRRTQVAEDLAEANVAVTGAQAVVDALEDEVERLRTQVGEFVSEFEHGRELEAEIARHREIIAEILDRQDTLELESQSPGYARIVSRAREPDQPTRGGRLKFLVAFALLAACVGGGATIAVDLLDRRIHDVEDLARTSGFPPLGWIAEQSDERTTRFAEDQIRRLALAIDRERRRKDTRRFVVLGIRPQAGASDLVERVGRELSAVGCQVLTVDANAFHHHESSGQAGLVDVLERRAGPAAAVVPGTPSHVYLGAREDHRRTLPAAHRLRDVLDELGRDFDVVLVDAPPLMVSSDAELLVGLSDATLLLVVAEAEDADEVKEALSVLERLSPPVVGLVLNRVRVVDRDAESQEVLREYEDGGRARAPDALGRWLGAS